MATQLKNLVLTEISLVDRGANPHAHVRLFKREVAKAEEPAAKLDGSTELVKLRKTNDDLAARLAALEAGKPESPVDRSKRLAGLDAPAEPPIAKTAYMEERLAKAQAARPAAEQMQDLAKVYRDQRLAAGTTLTAEKSYELTFMSPANADLAQRVRDEEWGRIADAKVAKSQARPASEKLDALAKAYKDARRAAGSVISKAKAYEDVYLDPDNADLARQVRAEEMTSAAPIR